METFLQQILNGTVIGSGYALIALGLTLIIGILHVLNFAHGEFYMLGAFATYLFSSTLGFNYIAAGALALLTVFIISIIIEFLVIRPLLNRDRVMVLLATFMSGVFLMHLSEIIFGTTPLRVRSQFTKPVEFGFITITQQRILVIVITFVLVLLFTVVIKYTTIGKVLRATAQNKNAAALVGININKVNTLGFGLAAGLAAMAGILLGPLSTIYPAMGQTPVIKGFVVVVLGGLGSMPGAIVGGLFMGIVEALGAGYISSQWKDLFGFSLLIIMLLFKPNGLFGGKESGV